MKFSKKLLLVLSAAILLIGSVKTSVLAATISTNANDASIVDGTFRFGVDTAIAAQAYGVKVTFTAANPGQGFGGAICCNSNNNSWNSASWSNDNAQATGNQNEYTITRMEESPVFGSDSLDYANIDIQSYWGSDINISNIEILGLGGAVLLSSGTGNGGNAGGTDNPTITSTVLGAQFDSSGSFLFGLNTGMAGNFYSIRITLEAAGNEGFAGTILCNSDLSTYNPKTFGLAGTDIIAVATGNTNEYTVTRAQNTPIYGSEPLVWSNMAIQSNDGSKLNITKLEFFDENGNLLVVTGSTADDRIGGPSQETKNAPFEDASVAVANMKIGWNLGNSLDSCGTWLSGDDPFTYECAWGNLPTTKALIQEIKSAGFNAVRVPVTYFQNVDDEGMISEAWLDRVETVVNYVLDEGMYCIINTHHDSGAGDEAWQRAGSISYESNEELFISIWTQVADRFSDYGGKLLFEGYNEMLDEDGTWTNPQAEDGYDALNDWAQLFVDTIRGTGGKNAVRNLIVNTYGADSGLQTVSNFVVPTDTAQNHLIAEVHIYTPDNFTASGDWIVSPTSSWTPALEAALDERFEILDEYFVSRGIPVIVGEFAAQNKYNDTDRAAYASYFVSKAKEYNITGFWWDDGGNMGIINRGNYTWTFPGIKNALINAANSN